MLLVALLAMVLDGASVEFSQRLDAYVKVRAEAAAKVPAVAKNSTPTDIDQRERALAEAIRKARPEAKQGNVFSPTVAPFFDKLLQTAFAGDRGAKRRDTIKEGNPKTEKAPGEVEPLIQVNAFYPNNAPLSSMPASLLTKLPKLPPDVEYRFVGRTLILRDRESNLIIDYLKGAAPAP